MEKKRSELKDNEFGLPEDRKYPLDSKEHVHSAMRLFGHCEESKRKVLAKNIAKKSKEYDMELTPMVKKYLKENYIVNGKDIYYNKDKFDNGEINLCFVIGHSGSGKTTMARKMEGESIEVVEMDDLKFNGHFTDENLKEYGGLVYSFFKGVGKKYRLEDKDEVVGFTADSLKGIYTSFINYAIGYANGHKNTKFVLEGIWAVFYYNPNQLDKYAVYIKGTSMTTSAYKAVKRDVGYRKDTKDKFKAFKDDMRDMTSRLSFEKRLSIWRKYYTKDKDSKYLNEGQIGELYIIDPTDDLGELEYRYEKFCSLTHRLRMRSDDECYRIYGMSNEDMYYTCLKNISRNAANDDEEYEIDGKEFNSDEMDKAVSIKQYSESINNNDDYLYTLLHKLDMYTINESLLESTISKELIPTIEPDKDGVEICMPNIVPFFTPEEVEALIDDPADQFLCDYKNACSSGLFDFNYADTFIDIQKIYNEYRESKDENLAYEMIRRGWNPSVEPTMKNAGIAYDRIKRYLKERYSVKMVDISKMSVNENAIKNIPKKDIRPIFVVISWTNTLGGKIIAFGTNATYSHSGFALTSDLETIYSFNGRKDIGGFSIESISWYRQVYEDAKIKVLCVFVTTEQYKLIENKMKYYRNNKSKTSYNFLGCADAFLGHKRHNDEMKMICSQFVDYILKMINVDITNKDSSLITPNTYDKISNRYVYIVYEGYIRDYNRKEVDKKVNALRISDNLYRKDMSVAEAVNYIFEYNDIILDKMININDNEDANNTIALIREALSANSIIYEKAFPLSISKKGIKIELNKDIESKYQESHKLLKVYDKNNDSKGMEEELLKIWSYNIELEKLLKKKSDDKKSLDLRARILNDFNTYMKKVKTLDKDFNFSKYYKNSPYYNNSIEISTDTLKYGGKLIKDIVI